MFSRAYRAAITAPPLLVAVFLIVPYVILFCYSFWSVSSSQEIVHSWTLDNYRQLIQVSDGGVSVRLAFSLAVRLAVRREWLIGQPAA